ncbi:MAG TPA: peptide chain release factor N(5)-glutamine methyltransferase [Kineosporiaceae bacterium]
MTQRLDEVLRAATDRLREAGVAAPRGDAERLAAHVLGVTAGAVPAAAITGRSLPDAAATRFADLVAQRAERIPLQHLTGRAAFRTIELDVGPGVFVPRPETEVVAGLAIAAAQELDEPLVVDLCTGSAAIALSVAVELRTARVVALEADPLAHAWAARNVERIAPGRVDLRLGDVADPEALADLTGRVDVVVANPPYIPDGARPVDPEVADHDPHLALYGGGADGLAVPAAVVRCAAVLLRTGGALVMEHGDVQGAAARRLVRAAGGWADVRTERDLTGRDRALLACRSAR